MSNEEKAKNMTRGFLKQGLIKKSRIQELLIKAMGWKEKQLIDRLEDWLANNICNAYNFRGDNISATFMNDCIKAMKGE
jgi:hypothetical protein